MAYSIYKVTSDWLVTWHDDVACYLGPRLAQLTLACMFTNNTDVYAMHSYIRSSQLPPSPFFFSFKGNCYSVRMQDPVVCLSSKDFDRSYYYLFFFFFSMNTIISDVAQTSLFQRRVSNDHSLLVLTTLVLYNHTLLASGPSHQPVRPVSYRFTPCHLPVGRLTNCRAVQAYTEAYLL